MINYIILILLLIRPTHDFHTSWMNITYDEETKELTDVDFDEVKLSKVPTPPKGKKIKNLEVVIRVQK